VTRSACQCVAVPLEMIAAGPDAGRATSRRVQKIVDLVPVCILPGYRAATWFGPADGSRFSTFKGMPTTG